MKSVIKTHDLCKTYAGIPVVDHLRLTVPQGCVYGFLGPNGAGKSTTMNIITGYLSSTEGTVTIDGYEILELARTGITGLGRGIENVTYIED